MIYIYFVKSLVPLLRSQVINSNFDCVTVDTLPPHSFHVMLEMELFGSFCTDGYHVYQRIRDAAIGEELLCEHKTYNDP